jgi:hypothetical protein
MWIKLSPAEAEYPKWQHQTVLVALPSPLKAANINGIRHIATQALPLQKTFQYMCRHGTTTECMNQSKAVTILEHKSWRRQREGSTKDYSFVRCSNINLERGRKFSPLTSTEGQNESEFLYSSMEHLRYQLQILKSTKLKKKNFELVCTHKIRPCVKEKFQNLSSDCLVRRKLKGRECQSG